MRINITIFFYLLVVLALSSCIQDEPLNAEADIIGCELIGVPLLREPEIKNEKITIYILDNSNITSIAPVFILSPGATIEPKSGTVRDFTFAQEYTVTSQNGEWKKIYTVEFVSNDMTTEYNFEQIRYHYSFSREPKYEIFYNVRSDGSEMEWGAGNAGYMIANSRATASQYPTSQASDGYIGKCAKLTTCSAGSFGAQFGAPIAAGNLFLGTFSIELGDMLRSTHFGVPFRYIPKAVKGFYRYRAGEVFTGKNNQVIPGRKDMFDIYAIFYEVTSELPYLDGTNALTADNLVAVARMTERKEADEWTDFVIVFDAKDGKAVDMEKLKQGKYNFSLVMTSSDSGASFEGAIGSTLWIDEVEVIYETKLR